MANFQESFFNQVNDLITRSNDKYSCIEDQFYYVDKFPKYQQDDDTVFKCKACGCLLHVDCLEECEGCEENYCSFKHTNRSVCNHPHDCASTHLKEVYDRYLVGATIRLCEKCRGQRITDTR